jgi:hypothetical protein
MRTAAGSPVLLKRCLLVGWAAWLTIVVASNILDACKAMGLLGENWAFASGNFEFVVRTTVRYGPPRWINVVLFGGVILWEGAAAVLLWLASIRFGGRSKGMPTVYLAFTASLTLWFAFMIADEVCIAYAVEGTHLRLLIGQLLSLLAIALLPEG